MPRTTNPLNAVFLSLACLASAAQSQEPRSVSSQPQLSIHATLADALPKMVKIYGAGGVRGLEPYQSGFLISDNGHILTAFSYVLDTDMLKVTLDDGRKYEAKLLGADPRLEIAVIKIDAEDLPFFDVAPSPLVASGTRVLALSNLFGVATGEEPVSVQRGAIMARTRLNARRGAFESPYRGIAYIVDAMTNNPGAAGGALVDYQGKLLGILGKELRNAQNGAWLNYALPLSEIQSSLEAILANKPTPKAEEITLPPEEAYNLDLAGVLLVPNVLEHTPPYIEAIRPGSPAELAGLRRDDLILFLGDTLVNSCTAVTQELARLDRAEPLRWTVKRGINVVEVTMPAPE